MNNLFNVQKEDYKNHFKTLKEPNRSLLLWLFDFCLEIEQYKNDHKLDLKGIIRFFGCVLMRTNENHIHVLTILYFDILFKLINLYKNQSL